jgi:hypothetical protein
MSAPQDPQLPPPDPDPERYAPGPPAGPTINGVVDTFHSALVEAGATDEDAKERASKLGMTLMRDWMPAGTALRRLGQAMQQGARTPRTSSV